MDKLRLTFRLLLGLMMLVFGLNVFLGFLPLEPPPENARPFMDGLMSSGYLFPLMGVIYLGSAVALLMGRGVGLALVMLAPISVNAFLFHVALQVPGTAPSVLFNLLVFGLGFLYRDRFKPLIA
jgi:hypothetical protein